MKRTILGAAVCLLSFISAAGVHRFTIPTTPTPRPDPALRWAGTTGDRSKPGERELAPGFGRFALEDGDLVWARGVQRIPNPVRKGKDGKAIVLGPIAHQGWDLRRVKIIQALNDGALVEYGRTTFFARGLRSPNGIADGEYVTTWLAETSETHSYTAVLGARHTVRVLEYGQVVRGEEAAKAITASLAEWKSTPEIMRR